MNSNLHEKYTDNIINNLTKWLRRRSRALKEQWLDATLTLLNIDLEPARETLESLYAPSHRGRPPYDPVCMFRSLLLMMLLGFDSFTSWVAELRTYPRLAVISGFASNSYERNIDTPSVGAYYLFIDRLEDGPYQKPTEGYIKPSQLRKIKQLRNLASEKDQRQKDKQAALEVYDSVTKKLKDDLQANEDQPRANDLQKRLEDILIQCAIIPSANRGLLGDLSGITLAGDGASLATYASPYGKPACNCREKGIYNCHCARYYSDPTANWGYDSYREIYYFGHTYYQFVVSTQGHDLPLSPTMGPASETDFTLSPKNLDRLQKALKENGLEWKIKYAIHDAGHDATGIYEYLLDNDITPIIALNTRSGTHPLPTGSAKMVNENGIPICPGGMLMRRLSFNKEKHRIIYTCPVKRPTHRDGKFVYISHVDECPLGVLCSPDTIMGPVVYVKTTDDPRLYPPIPRGTETFKELMNLRSGCERSNSIKKELYKLGHRPCRSATHFLVRLYLVSILEHARAWVAEDKKRMGYSKEDPIPFIRAYQAKAA